EGDVVKVGEPLISIRLEGPAGASSAPEFDLEAPPAQPDDEAKPKRRAVLVGYGVEEDESPRPVSAPGAGRRETRAGREPVAASPPVRRLAKEMGIDLASVHGTGQSGRVTREDVLRAAEATEEAGTAAEGAAASGQDQRVPVRGIRRLIAEKMTRSIREI